MAGESRQLPARRDTAVHRCAIVSHIRAALSCLVRNPKTAPSDDKQQKLKGRADPIHRAGSACSSTPKASPASSRSRRPSRWPRSATCRSPIRRASPCRCWPSHDNPSCAYDYTNKGNLVAVVSNGTAILGLGNLGALAAKPVMEGKGALFKRFADIDAIDLLVDTEDVDAFINCVRYLGPSFGGINLEDIKAPDCFIIEERLKELLDIPVFHDDQHGTAIIAAAGLINALELTGRDIEDLQARRQRRRLGGHRLPRAAGGDGHAEGERHPLRHQGRHLPGPQGRHEPVEVGLRRQDQGAHARRRPRGRRRAVRPVGQGRRDAGDGQPHGAEADHLRDGQPRSRDHARGGPRRARRRHHGDRALGLPEPDQQRAGLSLHLPRRARRAGLDHQRRDEDRRGRGARRARPRRGARSGRRRLLRPPPDVRPRLHHSRAVRSAPDHPRPAGGRQGGDGYRRRAHDRSSTWRPTSPGSRAASIRWPAGCSRPSSGCAPIPSASSLPRARSRPSSARPTPISRKASASRSWSAPTEIVREQFHELGMVLRPEYELIDTRKSPYTGGVHRLPLCAPAAARLPEARLPAPRPQRAQRLRRADGGARLRRRDGLRRHAQLDAACSRTSSGSSTRSPAAA